MLYFYDKTLSTKDNFYAFISAEAGIDLTPAMVGINSIVPVTNNTQSGTIVELTSLVPLQYKGTVTLTYDRISLSRIDEPWGHTRALVLPNSFTWAEMVDALSTQFGIVLTTADLMTIDPATISFSSKITFTASPSNPMFYGTLQLWPTHG